MGTNDAQLRALFRADQVLAAFPARERKIRRAHVPSAREVGQQRRAFIVGMSRNHQHRSQFIYTMQRLLDFGGARETSLRPQRRQWCESCQDYWEKKSP